MARERRRRNLVYYSLALSPRVATSPLSPTATAELLSLLPLLCLPLLPCLLGPSVITATLLYLAVGDGAREGGVRGKAQGLRARKRIYAWLKGEAVATPSIFQTLFI